MLLNQPTYNTTLPSQSSLTSTYKFCKCHHVKWHVTVMGLDTVRFNLCWLLPVYRRLSPAITHVQGRDRGLVRGRHLSRVTRIMITSNIPNGHFSPITFSSAPCPMIYLAQNKNRLVSTASGWKLLSHRPIHRWNSWVLVAISNKFHLNIFKLISFKF